MMRTLCAVLMGLKHVWMILSFVFCFTHLMAFFSIQTCSLSILQDKKLDVQFCLSRVKEFCDIVEQERSRFEEIYEATESTTGAPTARRGPAQDPRAHYHKHHGKILDNILCQTQTRFQDHEKLMFVTLLDPQKFREYQKKFPHAAFSSLTQSHGTLFDLSWLKTELTVMYAMDDFAGKSPTDLLDFLQQKNLSESMGQLYTFVCLAVTPCPLLLSSGPFQPLSELKLMPEIRQGRLDFQH
ncbi:zinc finger MYM-type protein 1-like isoform X1 [Scomber scombrus]|uniref:Zinc finger MYM-type protein 1-like isoform X1 n=1 Tax=Scomber scombrus TaxID=13677 RepID=A0AAV1PXN3_SCOSC